MDYEKAAEACDDIAAAYGKLANIFRAATDTVAPAKRTRGAKGNERDDDNDDKPAKRGTAKGKTKAAEQDEDLTIDDVREVLRELVDAKGKEKLAEALASVGAGKLADVDESQYGELVEEAKRMITEEEPEEAPAAKKRTREPAKKGPTAEDLLEKFKELIAADKTKAKAVLKDLGVSKISEVDDDDVADAMEAVEAALAEGDDDDML